MQLRQTRRRGLLDVILIIVSALTVVAAVSLMGAGAPAHAQGSVISSP